MTARENACPVGSTTGQARETVACSRATISFFYFSTQNIYRQLNIDIDTSSKSTYTGEDR